MAQEEELERAAEEKQRTVEDFENTMMGLEGGDRKKSRAIGTRLGKDEELERAGGRGVKRKFELDEEEMLKNAKEERAKARKALDDEKVAFVFSSDLLHMADTTKVRKANLAVLLGSVTHTIHESFERHQTSQTLSAMPCLDS